MYLGHTGWMSASQQPPNIYIYKTNLKTVDRKTTGFSLIAILVRLCDDRRCLLFHTPYVCVLDGDFRVVNNLVGGGVLPDVSTIERLLFNKHETQGIMCRGRFTHRPLCRLGNLSRQWRSCDLYHKRVANELTNRNG
jgi:hypothetical protein